jgi:hypothetical protein
MNAGYQLWIESEPTLTWGKASEHIGIIAEDMIDTHFGPRCKDYEPGCLTCQRWRSLDELLASPYDEEVEVDNAGPG